MWVYHEIHGLIRSVNSDDTDRLAYVGDLLQNFDKLLHVHQDGEDELIYPKIAQRAPACALHVDQMLQHHRELSAMLRELERLRDQWIRSADVAAGKEVADKYEALSVRLDGHLRREVTEVMPVADVVLSQKEIDQLAQHGVDSFDKKVMLAYLGIIFATNPVEDQKEFLKEIPLPVRMIYRLKGRSIFEKQFQTLFPGRPIPATI